MKIKHFFNYINEHKVIATCTLISVSLLITSTVCWIFLSLQYGTMPDLPALYGSIITLSALALIILIRRISKSKDSQVQPSISSVSSLTVQETTSSPISLQKHVLHHIQTHSDSPYAPQATPSPNDLIRKETDSFNLIKVLITACERNDLEMIRFCTNAGLQGGLSSFYEEEGEWGDSCRGSHRFLAANIGRYGQLIRAALYFNDTESCLWLIKQKQYSDYRSCHLIPIQSSPSLLGYALVHKNFKVAALLLEGSDVKAVCSYPIKIDARRLASEQYEKTSKTKELSHAYEAFMIALNHYEQTS